MSDDLQFEKDTAIERIHELHSETLEALTGGATIAERDTWTIKELAALAHQAGTISAADTNMLATEAAMIGLTVDQHAEIIVQKSIMFKFLVGKAAGLRKQALLVIQTCITPEEVETALAGIEVQSEVEITAYLASLGA